VTGQDRTEERKKLTAAWHAAVKRLLEAGYEPNDVFETMAAVGLDRSIPEAQGRSSPTAAVVLERSTPTAPPRWFSRG
jgi:hypothetical protein